jgi:hypothetical protein
LELSRVIVCLYQAGRLAGWFAADGTLSGAAATIAARHR